MNEAIWKFKKKNGSIQFLFGTHHTKFFLLYLLPIPLAYTFISFLQALKYGVLSLRNVWSFLHITTFTYEWKTIKCYCILRNTLLLFSFISISKILNTITAEKHIVAYITLYLYLNFLTKQNYEIPKYICWSTRLQSFKHFPFLNLYYIDRNCNCCLGCDNVKSNVIEIEMKYQLWRPPTSYRCPLPDRRRTQTELGFRCNCWSFFTAVRLIKFNKRALINKC